MKKILKIVFISLFALSLSPLYALLSTSPREDELLEENAVRYASVLAQKDLSKGKTPNKGIEMLKLLSDSDMAKLFLAYFYDSDLNTEKDSSLSGKYLSEIKDLNVVKSAVKLLAQYKTSYPMAIKIADFAFAKYGDSTITHAYLLADYNFRQQYKERYEEVLKILEADPSKHAQALFEHYNQSGKYDKMKLIFPHFDFSDMGVYPLANTLSNIIRIGDLEALEILSQSESFLNTIEKLNKKSTSDLYFMLAFCKKYGYGFEQNEAEAKALLEAYESLPTSELSKRYLVRQLASSSLKYAKEEVFSLAEKLKERGDDSLYIECVKYGYGIERNAEKAITLRYQSYLKDPKSNYNWQNIISEIQNLESRGKLTKNLEKIAYDILSKNSNFENNIMDIAYLNLILLGYGEESEKVKIFEYIKGEYLKDKKIIRNIDKLAYFYDNGVGTQKDSEKATALRAEIDELINQKNPSKRSAEYNNLAYLYAAEKKNLYSIFSPQMREYYQKKSKLFKLEESIANMSEADQALMLEFRDIFKLFFDKDGKEITKAAQLVEPKKKAAAFYEKVIAQRSQAIEKMAICAMDNQSNPLRWDSLAFRVLSLDYVAKASEYCPKLYTILAFCYENARACRGDKKLAADFRVKEALYENKTYLLSRAFELYHKLGYYKEAKESLEKREEIGGASRYVDLLKAYFYLMESPFKDVEYSRILIEKVKESATSLEAYKTLICFQDNDFLELGEAQFWGAKKYYEESQEPWAFVHRILINAYRRGLYCEKDMPKALELLAEYLDFKEDFPHFVANALLPLIFDIEDKNEKLFKNTIEDLLKISPDNTELNLLKAIAIDKAFGYENDITKRDFHLEKAAKKISSLSYLTRNFSFIKPSDSLLEKLAELSDKKAINAPKLFSAYARLNNTEEAAKYGKIHDSTYRFRDYKYEHAAYLITKAESPEALAMRYSKPKSRGQSLIYASLLYDGIGVDKDREKALEAFKKLDELWKGSGVGDDARAWLWKSYTESGDSDLAQALIDPKTKGASLFNSKLFVTLAERYLNNLSISEIGETYNLPRDTEHSKHFLNLAKGEYFSDYALDLIDFYSLNPEAKNLEKKVEIRNKARALLNAPKPSKREEINYPKDPENPPKKELKIISIN